MAIVKSDICVCNLCGWRWLPTLWPPKRCAKCKSGGWNKGARVQAGIFEASGAVPEPFPASFTVQVGNGSSGGHVVLDSSMPIGEVRMVTPDGVERVPGLHHKGRPSHTIHSTINPVPGCDKCEALSGRI